MNDLDQLYRNFLQDCPNASREYWEALLAQSEELGRQASNAALERLLAEVSSLGERASARGDNPGPGLFDLSAILAWRLSVYFREAAVAIEESRRPKSMEPGSDEQMDQYRALYGS